MTIDIPTPTRRVLYADEHGRPISSHSMLKTFRRCPKMADYKYAQRLQPRSTGKALRRGTWFHALLEAHYLTQIWEADCHGPHGDAAMEAEPPKTWQQVHAEYTRQFAELFDEEKDKLGDLPRELEHLMKSYLWHYGHPEHGENWVWHEVEKVLEAELPDGGILRGKVDGLVEDDYGLWLVDHKTHKRIPDTAQRLRDAQSAIYVWLAHKNGIPVSGFIWNYVKTEAIGEPRMLQNGSRLSKNSPETDYPTMYRWARRNDLLGHRQIRAELRRLQAQRFDRDRGHTQTSPFFSRVIMEKSPEIVRTVVAEAYRTHKRMHDYDFSSGVVERVPDRSCNFMCSYRTICEAELYGGASAANVRRQQYRVGDPEARYNDEKERED